MESDSYYSAMRDFSEDEDFSEGEESQEQQSDYEGFREAVGNGQELSAYIQELEEENVRLYEQLERDRKQDIRELIKELENKRTKNIIEENKSLYEDISFQKQQLDSLQSLLEELSTENGLIKLENEELKEVLAASEGAPIHIRVVDGISNPSALHRQSLSSASSSHSLTAPPTTPSSRQSSNRSVKPPPPRTPAPLSGPRSFTLERAKLNSKINTLQERNKALQEQVEELQRLHEDDKRLMDIQRRDLRNREKVIKNKSSKESEDMRGGMETQLRYIQTLEEEMRKVKQERDLFKSMASEGYEQQLYTQEEEEEERGGGGQRSETPFSRDHFDSSPQTVQHMYKMLNGMGSSPRTYDKQDIYSDEEGDEDDSHKQPEIEYKKQISVPLSSLTNPFTPTSRHKLLDEQLNQEMKSLYDQMELFPELKTQTKQEDASKKDQESQLHDYSNLSILSRPRRKAPSLEA